MDLPHHARNIDGTDGALRVLGLGGNPFTVAPLAKRGTSDGGGNGGGTGGSLITKRIPRVKLVGRKLAELSPLKVEHHEFEPIQTPPINPVPTQVLHTEAPQLQQQRLMMSGSVMSVIPMPVALRGPMMGIM